MLVLVAVALARRITTESTPPLTVHRTLATYVRIPGSAPTLAWPREGQAAVELEGVGSLGSSGARTPVPIASVAKVMTAYVTLLDHPLGPAGKGFVIRITAADVREQVQRTSLGESTVAVRVGELISERQALEALLLPSANNMAVLLGVHDAGSLPAFVARMNSIAHKLGMGSTTYTDPSGFDRSTVSTAVDQLKLARLAMRVPALASLVAQRTAVLPVAGRVSNYNGLLGTDGYVGVKTGSDGAGGGCLVFAKRVTVAARRLTVLGVVLGQRQGSLIEAALTSARRLGDTAAAALHVVTVLAPGTSVLRVSNVEGARTVAVTATAVREIGWNGAAVRVQVRPRSPVRSLHAGEHVAIVAVDGISALASVALAVRDLAGPSLGWRLRHLL